MDGCTLYVGDIHNKGATVCPIVERHIREYDVGTVVLLGDLLNDWDTTAEGEIEASAILHGHVRGWREQGVDVHVLLGNHDIIYLTPPGGRLSARLRACSPGYLPEAHPIVRRMLLDLEPRVAFAGDGILCTHAGVTRSWIEWCDRVLDSKPNHYDAAGLADWLNRLFQADPLPFMERVGRMRGGGYRTAISPLWADRMELVAAQTIDPLPFTQIVGHTPVRSIIREGSLWFCDTMSTTHDGDPIGDSGMLLYDPASRRFTIL